MSIKIVEDNNCEKTRRNWKRIIAGLLAAISAGATLIIGYKFI